MRERSSIQASLDALRGIRADWHCGRASKSVIVVGAGLAGLSAAFELDRLGHQVTVLEASKRVGGRVLTLREPFQDGQYAEAGAYFVPLQHSLLIGYIRLFGLPLEPLPPPMQLTFELSTGSWSTPFRGLRLLYYLLGQRVYPGDGIAAGWPVPLTPEERRLGLLGMLAKYIPQDVLDVLGNPRSPGWPPPRLRPYDNMTFAEFLRTQGASEGAVQLLSLGFYTLIGNGAESYSSLWPLRDIVAQSSCPGLPPGDVRRHLVSHLAVPLQMCSALESEDPYLTFTIAGGTDRLPEAFAQALEGKIVRESPVVRIEQDSQGVTVTCRGDGERCFEADYVICAIPTPPMRRIHFEPSLPPLKQKAVARLPNTSVMRVLLQTRTRFWQQQGLSASVSTDLPVTWMIDQTENQPGPKGILDAYMAGPRARALQPLSETERIEFVLGQADLILPGLRKEFEVGRTFSWDEDPWAMGGYCWFLPGQFGRLMPHLPTPFDRIYFAGDQTSALPGWMEGALESGLRAVREIHAAP